MSDLKVVDTYKGVNLLQSEPDEVGLHAYFVAAVKYPHPTLYIGSERFRPFSSQAILESDIHTFIGCYRRWIDKYGKILGLGDVVEK